MKNVAEFVKELEYFHFSEIIFHRNDVEKKVVENCTIVTIQFEYADFFEKEDIFWSAQNMTTLRRRSKQKINTIGGKGKYVDKLKRKEEDVEKKKQEEAHRLSQEA